MVIVFSVVVAVFGEIFPGEYHLVEQSGPFFKQQTNAVDKDFARGGSRHGVRKVRAVISTSDRQMEVERLALSP